MHRLKDAKIVEKRLGPNQKFYWIVVNMPDKPQAQKIWKEEGLPQLKLKSPWYGQSLGYWPEYLEKEAELALKGEHYQTGENMAENKTQV